MRAASRAAFAAPRDPDRQRSDGNAARHLHDRQERVQPLERPRLNRNAEHREHRLGRHHARQVRRAPGPRDDHAESARLGPLGVLEEQVRGAVADTTRVSCGTRSARSVSTACRIVSQSLRDPMMTPTRGGGAVRALGAPGAEDVEEGGSDGGRAMWRGLPGEKVNGIRKLCRRGEPVHPDPPLPHLRHYPATSTARCRFRPTRTIANRPSMASSARTRAPISVTLAPLR